MSRKTRLLMLLGALLLGLTAAGCLREAAPAAVEGPSAPPEEAEEGDMPPEDRIYQPGEVIRYQNTVLVVLGWNHPPGGDFNPPAKGRQYLAVDVLVGNRGDSTFTVAPLFQMSLKDASGRKYNLSGKANAAADGVLPNGEVSPGEFVRGRVGFQVPENLSGFTFVYEVNLIGLGEIEVDLGPEPASYPVPGQLDLGPPPQVFGTGESVEISDLVVQVEGAARSQGGSVIQPDPGTDFLLVDVRVENRGDRTREVSSAVSMSLKDASGRRYTFHLGAQTAAEAGLPDDELQPGEQVRGQIGFQVPEDAHGLIFIFDPDLVGYGKALIALPE